VSYSGAYFMLKGFLMKQNSVESLLLYAMLGAIGGGLFYLGQSINAGGMNLNMMMRCLGMGALAAFAAGLLRVLTEVFIPVLQSWLMLVILIFVIPMMQSSLIHFHWIAACYGYLSTLLWEGYERRLPKI